MTIFYVRYGLFYDNGSLSSLTSYYEELGNIVINDTNAKWKLSLMFKTLKLKKREI